MRKILDWLVWKTRLIRVFEWLSNLYWTKRNRVMICCECGFMVIPDASLPNEYGWRKMRNPNRWICHHCFDHYNSPLEDWTKYVDGNNRRIRGEFDIHSLEDLYEDVIEE